MSPGLRILLVTNWPLFIPLSMPYLLHHSVRVFGRDGLEGSFGILGLSASLSGMPNVPESEGKVWVRFIISFSFVPVFSILPLIP